MKKQIKTTEKEKAYFAREDSSKISRLAGIPLHNHVTIEKPNEQEEEYDGSSSIYFQEKEGLMSNFFNKPSKP